MSARDFDLAVRGEKIMDTVAGLAYVASLDITRDHGRRARLRVATEDAKEIGRRFTHFMLTVVPLAMTYDPAMSEPALRAWAATISEAMRK